MHIKQWSFVLRDVKHGATVIAGGDVLVWGRYVQPCKAWSVNDSKETLNFVREIESKLSPP